MQLKRIDMFNSGHIGNMYIQCDREEYIKYFKMVSEGAEVKTTLLTCI
jgi:hypothetical protein